MPAFTDKDLSLSEDELRKIIKNRSFEEEIKKRVFVFLNIVSSLKIDAIIKEKIKGVKYFLSKNADVLAADFFVDQVGVNFLKYAEEIYSKDTDILLAAVSKDPEVKEKFSDLLKSVLVTRGTLSPEEMVALYKVVTEIVDITGTALMTN